MKKIPSTGMKIRRLGLTYRAEMVLLSNKIETIGDLISMNERQLLKLRNFGRESLEDVKRQLAIEGLSLQQTQPGRACPPHDDIADRYVKLHWQISGGPALQNAIDEVLETLTIKEASVIRLRFGLDTNVPMTLEEVGQKVHVTRERVRQIETKALYKMRHPKRARLLRPVTQADSEQVRQEIRELYAKLNALVRFFSIPPECACGKYKGDECIGTICDRCNIKVT